MFHDINRIFVLESYSLPCVYFPIFDGTHICLVRRERVKRVKLRCIISLVAQRPQLTFLFFYLSVYDRSNRLFSEMRILGWPFGLPTRIYDKSMSGRPLPGFRINSDS